MSWGGDRYFTLVTLLWEGGIFACSYPEPEEGRELSSAHPVAFLLFHPASLPSHTCNSLLLVFFPEYSKSWLHRSESYVSLRFAFSAIISKGLRDAWSWEFEATL